MKKISTEKAPGAIGPYSQAMIAGDLLFTSGQIAINPASGAIEAQDIEGQTEQGCKHRDAILEAAGCTMEDVVKTCCFLQNITDFGVFNDIYGKYFTGKPARSCVEIAALPKGALVEVEVIAKIPEKRSGGE